MTFLSASDAREVAVRAQIKNAFSEIQRYSNIGHVKCFVHQGNVPYGVEAVKTLVEHGYDIRFNKTGKDVSAFWSVEVTWAKPGGRIFLKKSLCESKEMTIEEYAEFCGLELDEKEYEVPYDEDAPYLIDGLTRGQVSVMCKDYGGTKFSDDACTFDNFENYYDALIVFEVAHRNGDIPTVLRLTGWGEENKD